MDLLNVALQVVAIIAIIAVGAFIIVFLSDLLISIIDDHQGIFFRRGRGKEENHDNNYSNTRSNVHTPSQGAQRGFDSDFDNDFAPQPKPKQNYQERTGFVDLEAARAEQEELEKRMPSFFEEDFEEESEEEKKQKERLAILEERNRQLEEELKQKEEKLTVKPNEDDFAQKPKKDKPSFDDFFAEEKEVSKDEDLEEDADELDFDEYEKLIKSINQQVAKEFDEKTSPSKKEEKKEAANNFVKLDKHIFEEDEDEAEEYDDEEDEVEEGFEEETAAPTQIPSGLSEEIERLKAQLEKERIEREKYMLEAEEKQKLLIEERQKLEEVLKNKQIEDAEAKKGVNVLLGSEEEYLARLEVLQERLREAKKQLRINKREFVPLNKIKRTLDRDQQRLRRKEAQVAKQKVALFGVNNHDIDPQKQAELEQEMDMLEGLKLSVQHCEDVMRENADRFPVLEQTNKILSKNVSNLTADIEAIEKKLKDLKGKAGK